MSSLKSSISSAASTTASDLNIDSCYQYFDHALQIYESIGQDVSLLCTADGPFAIAMSTVDVCIAAAVGTATTANYCGGPNVHVTQINTIVSYCSASATPNGITFTAYNSFSSRCFYQQAASLDAAESSLCSIASVSGYSRAGCESTTTTSSSGSSSTSLAPSSVSTAAISSPTTTPASGSSHTSAGAIAGIAVGAVLGFVLIVAAVGWLVYRRRKQHRARAAAAANDNSVTAEKAQLHSDDVKPDRKELEGVIPRRKSRRVGGLTELDVEETTRRKEPVEMTANELVGSELTGSEGSTKVNGDTSKRELERS